MSTKYAVITGASAGIGRQTAKILSRNGYHTLLIARRKKHLENIRREIESQGGKCHIFPFDLTETKAVSNLVNELKKIAASVSVLANIAGQWHDDKKPLFDRNLIELEDETITSPIDIVKGEILLTKKLLPLFETNGTIINMSGTFKEDDTGWIPDFVAKKGIEAFTKMLSSELKEKNINVYAVRPYFVWTEAVEKFYPDAKSEAMKISKVTNIILDLVKGTNQYRTGEVIEIRP